MEISFFIKIIYIYVKWDFNIYICNFMKGRCARQNKRAQCNNFSTILL